MSPETSSLLWWAAAIAGGIILLWLIVVWMKGRPFTTGTVFRTSRLSKGNRLLPEQVLITPTSVVHYTPGWIGKTEETIHIAHIASVKINTGLLLSDVLIETSGGVDPIRCHGHKKGDAVRMKALIEEHQNAYYRAQGSGPNTASPRPVAAPSPSR